MNVGLLYTPVSIYQMTRGSLVLFVGALSVLFLRRHLWLYQYVEPSNDTCPFLFISKGGYPLSLSWLASALSDTAVPSLKTLFRTLFFRFSIDQAPLKRCEVRSLK